MRFGLVALLGIILAASTPATAATIVYNMGPSSYTEEGTLASNTQGAISFTLPSYAYYYGSLRFTGATLLSVKMIADSTIEYDIVGPGYIPSYDVALHADCTVSYADQCNMGYSYGAGFLVGRNDGFDFKTITKPSLTYYAPSQTEYGEYRYWKGDVTSRYEFSLSPSSGAVSYSLFYNYGSIPEPSSWAMLIAGFGLVGWTMRRRQHIARYTRPEPLHL